MQQPMESQFCCNYADQVISSHPINTIKISIMDYNINNSMSLSSSSSSSGLFLPISSSPPPSTATAAYIEHPVSKFDTLAGVAIKYGVEVADIRKMNGLVTDRQMFGLRFLQIPLPGRHPPSPLISNDSETPGQSSSEQTPPLRTPLRVTPQRKPSSAMNYLQSYYGLKPRNLNSISEGFEMAVYRKEGAHYLEDGSLLGTSPASDQPLGHYRKSRSLVKLVENAQLSDSMPVAEAREGDSSQLGEKKIRRRQKSETDFSSTPEMLLDNNSGGIGGGVSVGNGVSVGGGFSAITGKCLALRPKAANRTAVANDVEVGGLNPIPVGLGDSVIADGFSVRKSSSTSNLQDHDSSSSASIWSASKWSLKPDLQAFSTAAITKPIFDGLPKPIVGRRNKAALD